MTMRMGVNPGQITKLLTKLSAPPEFRDVIAFHPGHRIGDLETALVNRIENAEVMAEKEKRIWDIEIGLTGNAGKIVVAARILREETY